MGTSWGLGLSFPKLLHKHRSLVTWTVTQTLCPRIHNCTIGRCKAHKEGATYLRACPQARRHGSASPPDVAWHPSQRRQDWAPGRSRGTASLQQGRHPWDRSASYNGAKHFHCKFQKQLSWAGLHIVTDNTKKSGTFLLNAQLPACTHYLPWCFKCARACLKLARRWSDIEDKKLVLEAWPRILWGIELNAIGHLRGKQNSISRNRKRTCDVA